MKRIYTRAERAYAMAFLPDGKLAVAGGRPGQEGDVRVYDLDGEGQDRGRRRDPRRRERQEGDGEAPARRGRLGAVPRRSSPDGKKLAAGGCDRAVRVWDLSDGLDKAKLEQTVENHADWVLGLCALRRRQVPRHRRPRQDGEGVGPEGEGVGGDVPRAPEHRVRRGGEGATASAGFSVGADKQLRTWKPSGEGKQVKNAGGHGDEVFKIVANPKQPMLATSQRRQDGAAVGPRHAGRRPRRSPG